MKVFCINDEGWVEKRKLLWLWEFEKNVNGPKYGDISTVTNEYYSEGKLWYSLLEWPDKKDGGYDADCFIPLSDSDEYRTEKWLEQKTTMNPQRNF